LTPSQVVELGTMDLAAQARGEDALFSARLYFGMGRGRATFSKGWLPLAPVSRF
jgi:hypothetical protein